VGFVDGSVVGFADGSAVGCSDGSAVGDTDGPVGSAVGSFDVQTGVDPVFRIGTRDIKHVG